MPSTVRKPTSEPSEMTPPASTPRARRRPAPMGSVRKARAASRQLPKDDHAGAGRCRATAISAKPSSRLLRRLALGVLAEHLGVVAERERRPARAAPRRRRRPSRGRGPSTLALTSMRRGLRLAVDHVRRRRDRDVGHVAERDVPAVGVSIGSVRDVVEAVARLGRAPDLHVVGLAVAEDVADLLAGEQGRRRAPDVARLEAVPLGRGEVDLDLRPGDRRSWSSTCASTTPVDPGERSP